MLRLEPRRHDRRGRRLGGRGLRRPERHSEENLHKMDQLAVGEVKRKPDLGHRPLLRSSRRTSSPRSSGSFGRKKNAERAWEFAHPPAEQRDHRPQVDPRRAEGFIGQHFRFRHRRRKSQDDPGPGLEPGALLPVPQGAQNHPAL